MLSIPVLHPYSTSSLSHYVLEYSFAEEKGKQQNSKKSGYFWKDLRTNRFLYEQQVIAGNNIRGEYMGAGIS